MRGFDAGDERARVDRPTEMRGCLYRRIVIAIALLPCAAVLAACTDTSSAAPKVGVAAGDQRKIASPVPQETSPIDSIVERGRYLSDAGNCLTCHTRPDAAPFSGGVEFSTPLGRIYSTNITPDPQTGIGSWSAKDLRRAMHEGVAIGGRRLFPAFPYTSFTKVTGEDVDAIYAYLRTLTPVRYTPPRNGFLLRQRWAMRLWNSLFFEEGRLAPDATQTAEWNRGAYLVEGLGHCSACHTPRNIFMAEKKDEAHVGGVIQGEVATGKIRRWSSVNLTSAKDGLASWSVNDLAKYLHTGFSPRAGTFGPMNEVIVNSLNKLTPRDIRAMAVYIKSLPAREQGSTSVSMEQVRAGEALYKDRCEKCHRVSGRGGLFHGPPLAGSAIVQTDDPASLLNIILYGPQIPPDITLGGWETMKPFKDVLDDSQIAAISNYVRGSWGNRARPVSPGEVARQR